MKRFIILGVYLIYSITSYAGFNSLTHHSRANCLSINETVSWDAKLHHDLSVSTYHQQWLNGKVYTQHGDSDGKYDTWRVAAVHIGEAYSPYHWTVEGVHSVYKQYDLIYTTETQAEDCNIYDGWWDNDHPDRRS
jgi:hypothetical protein